MAHRRGFTRGGSKRQVTWVGPADQGFVSVGTGAKVIVATFAAGTSFEKPTVVRTRGAVAVEATSFGADLEFTGAYGLGVVSDQAVAAGVASIPGPWSDSDWDGWFVWRSFAARVEFSDATGILFPASLQHEVDSKSMRKVSDNETIVLVAESQAGAFSIAMHLRVLMKLS